MFAAPLNPTISMLSFSSRRFLALSLTLLMLTAVHAAPTLPGVGAAMQGAVDAHETAGAVTFVATKDKVLHLEATGFADYVAKKPMATDTLFWLASSTKPITAKIRAHLSMATTPIRGRPGHARHGGVQPP